MRQSGDIFFGGHKILQLVFFHPSEKKTCYALSSGRILPIFPPKKCSKEIINLQCHQLKTTMWFPKRLTKKKATNKNDIQIRYDVSKPLFLLRFPRYCFQEWTVGFITSQYLHPHQKPGCLDFKIRFPHLVCWKTHRFFSAELTWWLWRLKSHPRGKT